MPRWAAAATVLCALACLLTVVAAARGQTRARAVFKLIASACFVAAGALAMPAWSAATGLIALGLVLGAAGDACLLGDSRRALAVGMATFGAGHVAYLVTILITGSGSSGIFGPAPFPAVAVVLAAVALAYLWPRAGSLRVPVAIYIALITIMMTAAVGLGGIPTTLRIGAVLFYASDLFVARQRFVHRSPLNPIIGLPAYYAGQLLIAWSLAQV